MYQLSTRHGDSFNSLVDELFADFFQPCQRSGGAPFQHGGRFPRSDGRAR